MWRISQIAVAEASLLGVGHSLDAGGFAGNRLPHVNPLPSSCGYPLRAGRSVRTVVALAPAAPRFRRARLEAQREEDMMKRQPWGLYAIALPIIAVGLVVLGVPVLALLFAAFVLACPFIMVFVMGCMDGGNGTHDGIDRSTDDHGLYPTAGQRQARPSDLRRPTWDLPL